MPLPWKDVVSKKEYIDLAPEQKEDAKKQYFDSIVAPKVPRDKQDDAWEQFNEYALSLNTPKSHIKDYTKNTLKAGARVARFGLGIVNSPLAFVWGSQEAQHIDPKEYKKMPMWKQTLVSAGGGFNSAWKSITGKEWIDDGSWGTLYGEYFKSATGKTIEETLPDNLKWSAPTLEFLANVVSDPMISFGEAAKIARLRAPKNFKKNVPPSVIAELDRLEGLEAAEKKQVQSKLVEILNNRKDYIKWWEDRLSEMEKAEARTGPPLMKPGERSVPDLTAPRSAMVGAPKREFAQEVEKETPEITKRIQESIVLQKKRPRGPEGYVAKLRADEFREAKGLAPLPEIDKAAISKRRADAAIKNINKFRESKGLKPFYTRATGGLVAGVGEDENGNLTYDINRGVAGGVGMALGIPFISKIGKKTPAVAKYFADNPAWAKVHGMIGSEKNKAFSLVGIWNRVNVSAFDRFVPLKKVSQATYEEARKFNSYKDVAQMEFEKLVDIMKPVKNDEVIITDYIDAHRAVSRARRGFKNPGGVTHSEAKQAIREIENTYLSMGKDPQKLRDVKEGFHQWTHDNILKPSYESGLISKPAYEKIVQENDFYAAFDVLEHMPDLENIPTNLASLEYFSVSNQKIFQKIKGTEKQIANPIEATIRKFMNAKATIARNKVASTFIDDPGVNKMFRPVANSQQDFAVMKNQGLNPIFKGQYNHKEFDVISRLKDGKVEQYVVDKDIAEAMKQLTPAQAWKWVTAVNAVFRKAATTAYIPFTISNAFRDAFMAYTTAGVHKSPAKFAVDWGAGFWEGAKHEFLGSSDLTKEYLKSGGGFGWTSEVRTHKQAKSALFKKGIIKKSEDIITSPLKLVEKISSTVELAPRLGTFRRAKMVGLSSGDAALMARRSTIDFNRGGTWAKVANQYIPFLNARIQGRVTLANALIKTPGQTAAKIALSVGLPGMATYAWNRLYYSDLYDQIPEYVKQNYFTLIIGTDTDEDGNVNPKYFVIPKGDVGQMAWNPFEFGVEKMWEKDREATSKFLINYLSDLSPIDLAREGEFSGSKAGGSLLPPLVKGVAENWANLSFYKGTEIEPYYMARTKPKELRYKENTPELYKWAAKQLKGTIFSISPLKLQNFMGNVFAGYGREGLSPEAMVRGLTGRIIKTTGGEIERRAFIVIKDIETGYLSARAYANEAVAQGDKKAANEIMNKWNKGLRSQIKEFNAEFEKYEHKDKGGLAKSYMFTPAKRKHILLVRKDKRSYLDKQLSRRK